MRSFQLHSENLPIIELRNVLKTYLLEGDKSSVDILLSNILIVGFTAIDNRFSNIGVLALNSIDKISNDNVLALSEFFDRNIREAHNIIKTTVGKPFNIFELTDDTLIIGV